MKTLSTLLLTCLFAFTASGCRKSEDVGKIDDWTWDAPNLKICTSPDRNKRARADVEEGQIRLKLGEAGRDHPVDITVEHTEIIPAPASGKWGMTWRDDSEFVVDHPDLGTKTWTVEGSSPMIVKVKAEWHLNPKP